MFGLPYFIDDRVLVNIPNKEGYPKFGKFKGIESEYYVRVELDGEKETRSFDPKFVTRDKDYNK
jgi:hypothetical protein